MTTNLTEHTDGFDALDNRFMSLMSRFQVIKDTLGDFNNLPNELHPAAFVLKETVEDMVRFYGELQGWHSAHDHTPKAQKEEQSGGASPRFFGGRPPLGL